MPFRRSRSRRRWSSRCSSGFRDDGLTTTLPTINSCSSRSLSASSCRPRLNRGGDRQANSALWRIVFTRMACDPRTQAYVARRTTDGKTTKEIMRCLKRYVAREVYPHLRHVAD